MIDWVLSVGVHETTLLLENLKLMTAGRMRDIFFRHIIAIEIPCSFKLPLIYTHVNNPIKKKKTLIYQKGKNYMKVGMELVKKRKNWGEKRAWQMTMINHIIYMCTNVMRKPAIVCNQYTLLKHLKYFKLKIFKLSFSIN